MRNFGSPTHSRTGSCGFSLIEMLIAVAIVSAVLAVVMGGILQMQQRSKTEGTTVDVSQQTRDFIDQMVRDIHNVGYPPPQVLSGAPACTGNSAVACGVISYSPTQIIYEGDLDGSGTVYRVYVQLQVGAGGNCPCTLQRGAIRKSDALAGTAPTYFTEVNGVLNSGNGFGAATYPISLAGSGIVYILWHGRRIRCLRCRRGRRGHLHHDLRLLQYPQRADHRQHCPGLR